VLDRSLPERLLGMAAGEPDAPPVIGEALGGTRLGGRYEVEHEIGRGGFGAVYLARDERVHGRQMAVKVLHEAHAESDVITHELAALAHLRHPGIATPVDSGKTPAGRPYLVLQYIPGISLRQALTGGALQRERAARILRTLGSALRSAHSAGVWHLDLKPSNVLLAQPGTRDERAVIVDFGIARISGVKGSLSAGSLAYAAPEQLAGNPSAASDQYSLALIALEMLTGSTPQPLIGSAEALRSAQGLSSVVVKVLRRALSPQAEERFASIEGFTDALTARLLGARPLSRRTLASVACTALGILLAAGGYAWHLRREESRHVLSEVALLSGQFDALSEASRTTNVDPQVPYQAMMGILNTLQAEVDRGHREPELLLLLSRALMEAGMLRGHPGRRSIGRSEQGAELLRRSLSVAELLRSADPRHFWWTQVAVEKHDALASVLVELGQYDEAERVCRRGLTLLDERFPLAVLSGPAWIDGLNLRIGLSMTLSRVPFHRSAFEECLRLSNQGVEWRRQTIAGLQRRAERAAGPGDTNDWASYRMDLAGLLATSGYLLRDMGRYAEALRDYGESDALAGRFLRSDPQNYVFRWLLARNSLETGRTLMAMGRKAEARPRLEAAVREMRILSSGPAEDVQAYRSLSMALSYLALNRARTGRPPAQAGEPAEEALALNLRASKLDPENAKIRDEAALILSNAGKSGPASLRVGR
jgi:serine/threonine-protein kinase